MYECPPARLARAKPCARQNWIVRATSASPAARTMIDRAQDRFDLYPERLAADSAYGSAEMLAWLVHERGIEPHIPVFDKSERRDGAFERADFTYDHSRDLYPTFPR